MTKNYNHFFIIDKGLIQKKPSHVKFNIVGKASLIRTTLPFLEIVIDSYPFELILYASCMHLYSVV